MVYSLPVDWNIILATTNAAVNTDTTHTIQASPGAGFALRLVQIIAGITGDAIPGMLLHLRLRDSGGTVYPAFTIGAAMPSFEFEIPFPGRPLSVNTSLQVISNCNVTSQGFRITAHYYTDQVS